MAADADAPPRILVVEDDPGTLGYLSALLRDWGYKVDEALSGAEALKRIAEHCPEVVMSDLVMPGMSGMDLLQNIRAIPDCSVFFILITGHGSVSSAVSAITEGADECLMKPVEPEKLRDILLQHKFVIPA